MSYAEADYIPLSALQHYMFCPRQCALIHLDRVWQENVFTAEGRLLHKNVESFKDESRKTVKSVTSLILSSHHYGISGIADIVEFHAIDGKWQPYPVEYKRGRKKLSDEDRIQLCAQAFCLEEMLKVSIKEGALFYGQTRRREKVTFNKNLRDITEEVILSVHYLFEQTKLPEPINDQRCTHCSLIDLCHPWLSSDKSSEYLMALLEEI